MLKSKKYNLPKFGANKRAIQKREAVKSNTEQSLTEKYKERKKQLNKPGRVKKANATSAGLKTPVTPSKYR